MASLKQRAVSGMIWTALQKYSTMFISFISGIILARLLTPYDYGCIGMLAIFMVLAESFIDGGFGSALIQKKQPSQEDYSTIFWWNLGMAAFMYVILFLCAPAISRFYNIPLLCKVLRVQSLVLFIYAFNIVQRNQLRKNLNFKALSIVTVTTSLIALAVTVTMAYKGYGVWALVAQNLVTAAIPALVFWFIVKWKPIVTFSQQSFKELFSFGLYMFLSNILNTLCNNLQGLLIGRFYNPATMGYYSKGKSTEQLASTSISEIMGQVSYPLYAECQNDKEVLSNVIRRMTCTIAYITFPLMLLLILLAKPIFILLYSDRWLQSVPYFQVLCLAGLAVCLQGVNFQAVAAIGKGKVMFIWTIIKRCVGICLVVGGLLLFGIKGLLMGMVLQSWVIYLINAYLVDKYIGYRLLNQIKDLVPVIILSLFSMAISYSLIFLWPNAKMYLIAVFELLAFGAIYLCGSILFKMDSFIYFKQNVPLVFKKNR